MNSLVLKNIMWFPLFVVPLVATRSKTMKTHHEPTMLDWTLMKALPVIQAS